MKTTFPLHAEHSCTMNAYIAPTYIPVHSIALVSSTSNYNGVHVHCWWLNIQSPEKTSRIRILMANVLFFENHSWNLPVLHLNEHFWNHTWWNSTSLYAAKSQLPLVNPGIAFRRWFPPPEAHRVSTDFVDFSDCQGLGYEAAMSVFLIYRRRIIPMENPTLSKFIRN